MHKDRDTYFCEAHKVLSLQDPSLAELSQVQVQGLFGDARPPETPLVRSGLVPSLYGMHWARHST